MLFDDEEEGSELDDDDWEGDSASGGLGSNQTNENIEQGRDTSQQDTAHSFIWSDGIDCIPHLHPFDSTSSEVTDEWPCDDNA